ncbi:mCG140547, partial [Mus musculus]
GGLVRCRWKKSEPRLRRSSIIQSNHLSATRTGIPTSSSVVSQLILAVTGISLSSEIILFQFLPRIGLKFYFLHLLISNTSYHVAIKDAPIML